jgi:hypothetical protein
MDIARRVLLVSKPPSRYVHAGEVSQAVDGGEHI